jgi:hypothetical protein
MTCEGNANKVLLLYQKERTEERRLRFFSQMGELRASPTD